MSRGCTRTRATTRLKRPSALKQVLQLQDADTEIPLWHWPGRHKRHGFPVFNLRYWCSNDQFKVGFGSSWRMWGQFVLKHFEQLDIVNCKAGPTYCILWGGEKGQDKPEWGLQATHIFQPSTTRQHLQGEARSLGREHNMQEKYPFWRDTMHGKYVCWAAKCRSGTKAKCAS